MCSTPTCNDLIIAHNVISNNFIFSYSICEIGCWEAKKRKAKIENAKTRKSAKVKKAKKWKKRISEKEKRKREKAKKRQSEKAKIKKIWKWKSEISKKRKKRAKKKSEKRRKCWKLKGEDFGAFVEVTLHVHTRSSNCVKHRKKGGEFCTVYSHCILCLLFVYFYVLVDSEIQNGM